MADVEMDDIRHPGSVQRRAPVATVVAVVDVGSTASRGQRLREFTEVLSEGGAVVSARAGALEAVFASATNAVDAALTIRQDDSRLGVATGTTDALAGGEAMTRAFHLAAIANPGQILVGRATYESVAD